MVDSFLFRKITPECKRAARRPSAAYFVYQITATGKRQEKIEDKKKRIECGIKRNVDGS
jgi:hypothetical protein